jgi:hypothetical protein
MPTDAKSAIATLWTPYGLRGDPYFREALEPSKGNEALRPASLLVGRVSEIRQLRAIIENSATSRSVIQGEAGVGKTSFVNALKTHLQSAYVLTHADPIRVQRGMSAGSFIAEVLKVLLQIRATEQVQTGTVAKVRRRVSAGLRDSEGMFWTRLGRIINGEDHTGIGVTAGVVGMRGQRARIAAEARDLSLFDELKNALRWLAHDGTRRIVLHVNNMENLGPDAAMAAADLMLSLRDAFQFDHAHWLFVGTTDIEARLFRVHQQVSQIIDRPVTLDALTPSEVAELLARRYAHLRLGIHQTPPIPPAVAAVLYERFAGELRGFLGLLSAAVRAWAPRNAGLPMSLRAVIDTMGPTTRAVLVATIGENDAARLDAIVTGQAFDAEFRVTEVKERCAMTQAGASKLIQRLAAAGVIRPTRRDGKSAYYTLAGGALSIALNTR